ncbi:hypothetical protein [Lysinibacter cavernae]|uniref:Uncharacterized protein n=1 Tax=Lysinibacter cavernae TaxID=1640652 RepID=A0A7X5TSV3_9MICO|nr:hypothetical protein [Lysinibacter cavernae]NIH53455.1 hypothetical protein [Lysinibacter cavernae]
MLLVTQALLACVATIVGFYIGLAAGFALCSDLQPCDFDQIQFGRLLGLFGPFSLLVVTTILVKAVPLPKKAVVVIESIAIVVMLLIPLAGWMIVTAAIDQFISG